MQSVGGRANLPTSAWLTPVRQGVPARMDEDGDLTQITMSQTMADKPSTSLRPNHNYSANPSQSGKVTSVQQLRDVAGFCCV